MGKKRAVSVDSEKVRFELRFDEDVYQGVQKLAEATGVSVNQLMQGLARWAVDAGHGGEEYMPERHGGRGQPGVVWFEDHSGSAVLELDFTERRVVRELGGKKK